MIKDEIKNISFTVFVHYQNNEASRPISFSPYTMDVSSEAEIIDSKFPLIIVSHGNNGSHLLYRKKRATFKYIDHQL